MPTTESLQAVAHCTAAPAGEALALPPSAYRCPDLFALERRRIFHRDWVAVSTAAELSRPGDYVALRVAGEPVLVLRGADGQLRALSNICRHRGTLLLPDGRGHTERIVCPYHAWSYDDRGTLLGVPYQGASAIDRDQHALRRFALEVWAHVVFVNLDGHAPPLAPQLAGVDRYLRNYELDRYTEVARVTQAEVWNANWKIALENAMESYHLFKVHPGTFELNLPTRHAFHLDGAARWSATAGLMKVDMNRRGPMPSRAGAFERDNYVLVSIPPSFVAMLTLSTWAFISVLPRGESQCVVQQRSLTPAKLGVFDQLSYTAFSAAFLEEDRRICERAQSGMQTEHAAGGRLLECERVIGDFHQYLGWQLFEHTPEPRSQSPEARATFGPLRPP